MEAELKTASFQVIKKFRQRETFASNALSRGFARGKAARKKFFYFNKKNPRHNYFDIIINESGDIYFEPWDELWGEIFKKNRKSIKSKNTKVYKYCG